MGRDRNFKVAEFGVGLCRPRRAWAPGVSTPSNVMGIVLFCG